MDTKTVEFSTERGLGRASPLGCSYCKNDSVKCVQCRCELVFYCSAKCQVEDWSGHKSVCRKIQPIHKEWIEKINKYFTTIKNDNAGKQGIWQDVFIEYNSTTPKKRGVVVSDITEEIKPEIDNSSNDNDPRRAAINGALASIWHYIPHDNEKFIENINGEYNKLLELMKTYNPEKQFVLMAFCSDPAKNLMCHSEEIISVTGT